LFGLNADFLENDSFAVGRTFERRRFPGGSEGAFTEMFICPSVLAAMDTELACGIKPGGFPFTHIGLLEVVESLVVWAMT
jgi:hypothetical protein